MSRVTHKLRDQSGASMAAALLLFLVCVSLSAVVLTAGTAASGRVSELATMDRRYYNVTSAARAFKKAFDGEKVEIKRTKKETYINNVKQTSIIYENKEEVSSIDSSTGSPYSGDPLYALACTMVYGTATGNDAKWSHDVGDYSPAASSVSEISPMTINVSVGGTPDESLKVNVTGNQDCATGNLALTLANTTSGTDTDTFKFPIGLSATVNETQDSHTEYYYSTNTADDGTVTTDVTSIVTTTKKATITWQVTSFGYVGGEVVESE